MPPPPAVDAFPAAASPFGVEAMVASVREWTDVFVDDHTARAVLRGGSYWSPLPQPDVVRASFSLLWPFAILRPSRGCCVCQVMRYFYNGSAPRGDGTRGVGYTDGAPNWYLPNEADPVQNQVSNMKPLPTPLTHHTTFLLMHDGLDRSAGIGFRCAADA